MDDKPSSPKPTRTSQRAGRLAHRVLVVPFRQVILAEHPAFARYFTGRCPHLAGMIAFFALMSIIPGGMMVVTVLGWVGALEAEGYLADQIHLILPGGGGDGVIAAVNNLRRESHAAGPIGLAVLLWSTTSFFASIESALNLVYGAQPRPFLRQKLGVFLFMTGMLALVTIGTVSAAVAVSLARRTAGSQINAGHWQLGSTETAASIVIGLLAMFLFLLASYRLLPNARLTVREVWSGALLGAIVMQVATQMLPWYVSEAGSSRVTQAFAGAFVVLLWFYIAGLVLLAGAVWNWWLVERRTPGYRASA